MWTGREVGVVLVHLVYPRSPKVETPSKTVRFGMKEGSDSRKQTHYVIIECSPWFLCVYEDQKCVLKEESFFFLRDGCRVGGFLTN